MSNFGGSNFDFFAEGAGNAAEAVTLTYVIPSGKTLRITNCHGGYKGAGTHRIRMDSLVGLTRWAIRYGADGSVLADFASESIDIDGGTLGQTIVVTQEGAFANFLTVVARLE